MDCLSQLFHDIRDDLSKAFGRREKQQPRLVFLFNPSHEMALADGTANYTPPAPVRQMEADLVMLPAIFAQEGDWVMDATAKSLFDAAGKRVDKSRFLAERGSMVPFPWGWNATVRKSLLRFGFSPGCMPDEGLLEQIRAFACRRFHARYIRMFLDEDGVQRGDAFVGQQMAFCDSLEGIGESDGPFIFKLPWSSSGRGVFTSDKPDADALRRLTGFLHSQGGFLKDRFYQKTLDFAMEFYVFSDGEVRFVGYSVFQAASGGKYGGNMVDSQQVLEAVIAEALGSRALLELIRRTHARLLEKTMAGRYTGFVGIDMMVVNTSQGKACHPCVELNPRLNMGILAIAASQRPFFFSEEGGGGSVVGDRRRSSERAPSAVMRERGFHTCFSERFISIRYS